METIVPILRPATVEDAAGIAPLLGQLGYPCTAREVTRRLSYLADSGDETIVAEVDGQVAGVLALAIVRLLHRPAPMARITALVVDGSVRGAGIGARLLAEAEIRARVHECDRVELTSNIARGEAHRFYERYGYRENRKRFLKELA